MCFDVGIVTCGPNEALVISGMCQVCQGIEGFKVCLSGQCRACWQISLHKPYCFISESVNT